MQSERKDIPTYVRQAIEFYERSASRYRRAFIGVKTLQLFITAFLTIVTLFQKGFIHDNQSLLTGISGASLLALEGIQQTLQLQPLWVKYRGTYNILRREQMLYENDAGPYKGNLAEGETSLRLFTERADSIIGAENSDWMNLQEDAMSNRARRP
ncbi:MAG TPA: DUF4231 domain-containing protein [Edaphobacter sp.]|nr:DUF4231 domain-containing protein [Edaphobacter sp.]